MPKNQWKNTTEYATEQQVKYLRYVIGWSEERARRCDKESASKWIGYFEKSKRPPVIVLPDDDCLDAIDHFMESESER